MTYSIAARDPETGALGVAVQSHFFAVGATVPWLAAGVGAVATQSLVLPAYGPRGLDLMRAGVAAPDALRALVAIDGESAVRQVAMVDASGVVACHTGERCIADAGHRVAAGVSVQANMMRRPTVPDAMLAAYESSSAPFGERLMAALDAAEAEGGDIRGRQSAAIVIVAAQASGHPWEELLCDLRVEDHAEPVVELRRLLRLRGAYDAFERAELLGAEGDGAGADALRREAVEAAGDNPELGFWHALELVGAGRDEEARPLLDAAFAADPGWRELVPRLVAAGLVPPDDDLVARVLG